MVSVFGVTGMFFDGLLSMFLSEGMMIFVTVLLIASIIGFIRGKGRSGLRACCVLVGLCCAIYLCGILALIFLFGSNHRPAEPVPQQVPADSGYSDYIDMQE